MSYNQGIRLRFRVLLDEGNTPGSNERSIGFHLSSGVFKATTVPQGSNSVSRPQYPQGPNNFNGPKYQYGPIRQGLQQYPQGYQPNYYNQQQTQQNQRYNPPPRPTAQKPQPKPEPMDIDPSIRTNAINSANKPNFKYAGKRQGDSNITNPPLKAQRNYM
ncbi:PREDICTED: uncharacterized protein LOC108376472 [Rhagoletis zephyria]|uniref:uncharacterized protein LOC108376472 n=1 Tax=Rhagoletis zephyria TaxID=28612 RepID=UPI0008113BC8|nr:PREDICTED: uncharacterized protein LOC108376472 [Rhagoletis zephyria]